MHYSVLYVVWTGLSSPRTGNHIQPFAAQTPRFPQRGQYGQPVAVRRELLPRRSQHKTGQVRLGPIEPEHRLSAAAGLSEVEGHVRAQAPALLHGGDAELPAQFGAQGIAAPRRGNHHPAHHRAQLQGSQAQGPGDPLGAQRHGGLRGPKPPLPQGCLRQSGPHGLAQPGGFHRLQALRAQQGPVPESRRRHHPPYPLPGQQPGRFFQAPGPDRRGHLRPQQSQSQYLLPDQAHPPAPLFQTTDPSKHGLTSKEDMRFRAEYETGRRFTRSFPAFTGI